MIIYNVTIKPEWSIHEEWVKWMQKEHIPEMLATQLFYEYKMMRLLEVDEVDGPTYAIQYRARELEDYQRYIRDHAALQREKGIKKWGNKFVAFRSLMQIVN